MKAHFITLLFLCFSVHLSLAQKVKIKNEIATVDDSEYVQIKKVRGANAVSIHEIESGEEVIFVRWMSYSDPSKVSNSNPKGDVRWVELKFLTLDLTCEIDSRARKGLIRFFLDNELFENGELNEEAVRLLVKKYGSNFTANRPESVIIINN